MFGIVSLVLTIILNLVTAFQFLYNKDIPHFVTWFFYAMANFGFLYHMVLQHQAIK